MSDVPLWIQTLQALATPVIGATVGVVAFMQWRTAHQKVLLDLFEKRLAVYQQVRLAVGKVQTSGTGSNESDIAMLEAIAAAQFLFGDDMSLYLKDLWTAFAQLRLLNRAIDSGNAGADASDRHLALFQKIDSFYKTGPIVFGRYMRMDQALIPTPTDWFRDRNRKRLSYADEKQR